MNCNINTDMDIVLHHKYIKEYRNIIKGAYERSEKYVSKKNNTRKIKKNYL